LVGNLSLALRKAGEGMAEVTRRVTVLDLQTATLAVARERPKPTNGAVATVTVTRASSKQDYSVPSEKADGRAAATVGERAGH